MILKLSKTALRELTRLYHYVLMGVIISSFISATAYATVPVDNGDGTQSTVYTSDEVDGLLSAKQDTLIAGSVQTNNLADSAVTADKIADDAVGQNHIANGAVGTAEIKNESITKTKLDSSLQTSIDQVDTNKTAIETLTGDANTTGSVANTVNSAVNNLATGAVATNTAAITANTNAIEILNGNASTEGSVAKTVADAVSTKQDKLSDAQMNAVNSGITIDKVATYDAYAEKIEAVQTGKANTADVYTKDTVNALLNNKADATAVSANTANITNNSNAIDQNTDKIAQNTEKISNNTADIAALQTGKADATTVYTKTEADTKISETKTYAEEKANSAETNAKAYTNELANGAVKENTDKITQNAQAIATNTTNISANKTAIDILNGDETVDGSVAKAVKTAETNANAYTDAQDAETLASAKTYTDTQDAATLATAQADASAKATAAEANAKSYTDTQVADAKSYAEEKANTAETNAKSYTDTLIGTTDILVEQNGVIKLGTVNENIAALNETIGNVTDLNQYAEGASIGNALTQGGTQSADTVVAALNNIDATLGTIHGLRDKLAASGAGTNLASGTTVEQHLTALDSAIGNRAYTSTRYVSSGSDLSTAVSALDSNLSRVEGNLDALTNRTNKMHHEMKSGFASLAAMSALVPNARVAGDTQISVGAGHYRGTTGFALGAFHHVNDNVLLNAGAAYGGNGSATFKGGLTFGW